MHPLTLTFDLLCPSPVKPSRDQTPHLSGEDKSAAISQRVKLSGDFSLVRTKQPIKAPSLFYNQMIVGLEKRGRDCEAKYGWQV